ncbi:MAG: hypothetical protein K2X66_04185, partial [Cyanobacteria bacterium]|nr:hypothetical protein [Cyanobacteriota bacterium]
MTQPRQIGYFTQVSPNLALVQPIQPFGQPGQQQNQMLMFIAQPDQVSSAFSTNFNTPQQWGNRPYQLLNPQFRGGGTQGQSWQPDQTRETNLAAQFMQLMRYFFQKLMEILFGHQLQNAPDGEAGNPDGGGFQPISSPDGTAGLNNEPVGGPAIPGAVGANETARAHGDPHIVGGNGAKYDFDEIGTFNL